MIDKSKRYQVAGHEGIAFYCIGYETVWTEEEWIEEEGEVYYNEPQEIENPHVVKMVMIGDDAIWIVDVDDLTEISEDDYCPECGQIGCKAYGER